MVNNLLQLINPQLHYCLHVDLYNFPAPVYCVCALAGKVYFTNTLGISEKMVAILGTLADREKNVRLVDKINAWLFRQPLQLSSAVALVYMYIYI